MRLGTRLAIVAFTAAGLVGLANEAASQCIALPTGPPATIVLANPVTTQPAPAPIPATPAPSTTTTTTAQGITTTTQGGVTTTAQGATTVAPTTTQTVIPAGGFVMRDGRLVPAASVTGSTSYYTTGAVQVDANGNPIVYPTNRYVWPNGVVSRSYIDANGTYISTPFTTYWEPISEMPRRGLFRRR